MSFGLGISFGRLCRRGRSLEGVYLSAPRIGWPEPKELPFETNAQLRAAAIRELSKSFEKTWRKYEKM
jgi:hypothetical protein